jgi:hypothetical protein
MAAGIRTRHGRACRSLKGGRLGRPLVAAEVVA